MNVNVFNSYRALHGQTLEELSGLVGMTRQALHRKLNDSSDFDVSEIKRFIEVWNLTPDQMYDIFFKEQ